MLKKFDLIPKDFNYKNYLLKYKLDAIINENVDLINTDISEKIIYPPNLSVDPNNKIPFPPEFDDLIRLHYITLNRKVTTILEFGVGKSTPILGHALSLNKKNYCDYTSKNLRRGNLYQCHSIDNNSDWVEECRKIIPDYLLQNSFNNLHHSRLDISEFSGKICTYYDPIPNVCPDLIYLDGPDQFSPNGDIRGLTTDHQDRMPMAADILSFEHFLQPGTLIIIDGRTANARFLKCNLQRDWGYFYSQEWDQHFFELQEESLGVYNKRMLDHCLGKKYFKRVINSNNDI